MLQRGRKSSAALVAITDAGTELRRLAPIASLTDEQRRIWLQTVNARPAEWFGPEQIPLLEGYCRHAAYAAAIAQEIDQCEPEWLRDEDGLARHRALLDMHEKQVRAMSSLATRLRLTNQAVTDDEVFGKKGRRRAAPKVWQREPQSD